MLIKKTQKSSKNKISKSKKLNKERKSTTESATLFDVGVMKKGNDGNTWVIVSDKNNNKSADQIFKEIKNYYDDYEINKYEFSRPINTDIPKLNKFCKLVMKNKLAISWIASAAINSGMNERIFSSMRSSGCEKLIFN